jgi:hypothetical protein
MQLTIFLKINTSIGYYVKSQCKQWTSIKSQSKKWTSLLRAGADIRPVCQEPMQAMDDCQEPMQALYLSRKSQEKRWATEEMTREDPA